MIQAVLERAGVSFSPRIEIGDDTSIEQGFHLACAEQIIIGKKVAITEYVGIFDIWHSFENIQVPVVDQPLKTSPVKIGDHSLIGMGAVIQPGVTIGKHCVIGANSVVIHNIPDYSVAVGAPARVIKQFDPVTSQWIKVTEKISENQ
jgi:acetyltransferase-like isoleucine patch superfamily enzyme